MRPLFFFFSRRLPRASSFLTRYLDTSVQHNMLPTAVPRLAAVTQPSQFFFQVLYDGATDSRFFTARLREAKIETQVVPPPPGFEAKMAPFAFLTPALSPFPLNILQSTSGKRKCRRGRERKTPRLSSSTPSARLTTAAFRGWGL